MEIDCIEGWKRTAKLSNITIEDNRITILDGVCDSCDLCKITSANGA